MLADAGSPIHDVTELNPTYGFGVGEIISTADDLTKFLSELLGGNILPPAQLEEMLTMIAVPDGAWLDGYSYGHGGMIAGTWSYLFGTRDGHLTVAENVNGDWGMPPTGIFLDLLEAAFAAQER